MTTPKMKAIVGVDVGGTFTDFVVFDNGVFSHHKVLSTPDNPATAVLRGLEDLRISSDVVIVHGSTVATNALLERKGARTALVTTEGFEDVLEIGRQNRSELYDLTMIRPAPLVPSERRLGAPERVDSQGAPI
ncbi:hydantoinase/oxoprolinase family protein, partial [Dehalococcoidia bacterium]|nr:hydantoinase/oxoprolinase family protein [Dehalococcoidia bacterium]